MFLFFLQMYGGDEWSGSKQRKYAEEGPEATIPGKLHRHRSVWWGLR